MANKPLQSIKFPGLSDTYIVPRIDDTLSVEGRAADAKVTGDKITGLKEDLSNFYSAGITGLLTSSFARGRISTSGNIASMPNYCYNPDYISNEGYLITINGYKVRVAYYNANKEFISATADYVSIITNKKIGTYIRVCVSSTDESEIPISEYANIKNNLSIKYWIDKSLSIPNVPADSKTVGDAISENKNGIANITKSNEKYLIFTENSSELDISGAHITVDKNEITIDGTSTNTIIVKLSNGVSIGNTARAAWKSETVEFFDNGKLYNVYSVLLSGDSTVEPLASARNSNATSVISNTKANVILNETISYVQLWCPAGTYDNAKYKVIITNNAIDTEIEQPVNLNENYTVLQIPHFKTITALNNTLEYSDNYGYYSAIQGFCSDHARYLYWAIWTSDANVTNLRKYDTQTGQIVKQVSNYNYGHCNGLAYIPHENVLYAIKLDITGTVFKINAETLEYVSSFSLNDVLSPLVDWWVGVGAVAYNAELEKIIFLLRGEEDTNGVAKKGFAIFDKFMNLEKIIKTVYVQGSAVYGGIESKGDVIYLSDTMIGTNQNKIIAYDFKGNVIYSVNTNWHNHLEGLSMIGNTIYTAFANNFDSAIIDKSTVASEGYITKAEVLSQYNMNY